MGGEREGRRREGERREGRRRQSLSYLLGRKKSDTSGTNMSNV